MRKWRLKHLLFSWFAYWIAIVAIKLGAGIVAAWRVTRGPDDGLSGMGFKWSSESGLHLEVTRAGATLWETTTSLASVIGWAVVPPLILWILWLWLGANERSAKREIDALPSSPPDEIRVKEHITPVRDRR